LRGEGNGPKDFVALQDGEMAELWKKIAGCFTARETVREERICSEIFESMAILADGSVTCGCADIFEGRVLGNAAAQPIEEIFRGEKYRELRRRMISGELPPQCLRCPLRVRRRTGRETEQGGPLSWLQVDPAFNCNLRCPDCALTEMRDADYFIRPRTALSLDTFHRLVDQAASTLHHIRFHMLGEPFLNPNAVAMLQYARDKVPGVFLSIETNGILLDPPLQKALVDARVDYVKFSIDGATQEVYEKYRVGGDLRRALDNMAGLINLRREADCNRPRVIWQYILFQWNDSDEHLAAARAEARRIGMDELYWLITHSRGASQRFVPDRPHPELEGPGESVNFTIELAGAGGRILTRPEPNLKEYDPWK